MRKPKAFLAAASLALMLPAAAHAMDLDDPREHPRLGGGPTEQDRAFRAAREGRSMPLPMIERMVRQRIGDVDYLGPELRGGRYRLKYMGRNGRVLWVDVDAASGRILDTSED